MGKMGREQGVRQIPSSTGYEVVSTILIGHKAMSILLIGCEAVLTLLIGPHFRPAPGAFMSWVTILLTAVCGSVGSEAVLVIGRLLV